MTTLTKPDIFYLPVYEKLLEWRSKGLTQAESADLLNSAGELNYYRGSYQQAHVSRLVRRALLLDAEGMLTPPATPAPATPAPQPTPAPPERKETVEEWLMRRAMEEKEKQDRETRELVETLRQGQWG